MAQTSQIDVHAHIRHYSDTQRVLFLQVARAALTHALQRLEPAQAAVVHAVEAAAASIAPAEREALWVPRACFVTLWNGRDGELRGCRGECRAQQPLAFAVGNMALAAGLDDPRFPPVTAAELGDLQIEISVLTPLQPVEPHAVEVGRHGLLLVAGDARGLLLPQVAVEHHLQRDQFLEALCWKAGLASDAWRRPDATLWAFETEAWTESPSEALTGAATGAGGVVPRPGGPASTRR